MRSAHLIVEQKARTSLPVFKQALRALFTRILPLVQEQFAQELQVCVDTWESWEMGRDQFVTIKRRHWWTGWLRQMFSSPDSESVMYTKIDPQSEYLDIYVSLGDKTINLIEPELEAFAERHGFHGVHIGLIES